MRYRYLTAITVILFGWGSVAAAQDLGASNLDRLEALELPSATVGDVILHHSPSAEAVGMRLAAELDAAVEWVRRHTEWEPAPVQFAVLNREDFPKVTGIPYPTPHAEGATGLLIVADDVSSHPGFDLWDIPADELNAAWTFHELGHLVTRDLGIWSRSAWINELTANLVMAAYVRAERPEFAAYQSGLPPRFRASPGYDRLADLDAVYFQMGQLNYLWFHFQIARLADLMVAGRDFSALMADLRRAFPADDPRAIGIDETFARLERIHPGITAAAGPLAE